MARVLGIVLAKYIFITMVSTSLGKVYDIGEEPASCPDVPELPPPFEGWEFLTCKSNTWMWASLNAGEFYDHQLACYYRQNENYGYNSTQSLVFDMSKFFLEPEGHLNENVVEILQKLTPKRRFWYGEKTEKDGLPCDSGWGCQECFTYAWSEEKKDFDTPVKTNCNEEHYGICFGVLGYLIKYGRR